MRIKSLATQKFKIPASDYQRVWMLWLIRRRAFLCAAFALAIIAVGFADIRITLAAIMLAAVMRPMIALLLWNRLLGHLSDGIIFSTISVNITDGQVTVTNDEDFARSKPSGLKSATAVGKYLVIQKEKTSTPIIIPREAITELTVAPETFD